MQSLSSTISSNKEQHYLEYNTRYVDKIIKASSAKRTDDLLNDFLSVFYLGAPSDYLEETDPKVLHVAAKHLWEFASERKESERLKLRVYNPSKKEHGWESPRTVIELCTVDSPFLLDSLVSAISRQGYRIYEVIHPIVYLSRDDKGKVKALHESPDSIEGVSKAESIMQFQITHIAGKTAIADLKKELESVLNFVALAVADWREMRDQMEIILRYLSNVNTNKSQGDIEETKDFLAWMIDNNFIFLGYRHYRFIDDKKELKLHVEKDSELGIFRSDSKGKKPLGLSALPPKSLAALKEPTLVDITKSNRRSIIHRNVHMDYVGVKEFDENGKVIGEFRFLGLFTSAVYFQSADSIPIIRKKIQDVIGRSGFLPNSHNGKALKAVLEDYPRDELLQSSVDELFHIGMGIVEIVERPQVRLFVRRDRFTRFVSCMVFIPRVRFNTDIRQKIQNILEEGLNGKLTDYYTQVTDSPLARLHVIIKLENKAKLDIDVKKLEEELYRVTNRWDDRLYELLTEKLGERDGEKSFRLFQDGFSQAYKDHFDAEATLVDITKLNKVIESSDLQVEFYRKESSTPGDAFGLKFYHCGDQLTLSQVLPKLEHLGFHVMDERSFKVKRNDDKKTLWLHDFKLLLNKSDTDKNLDYDVLVEEVKDELEQAIKLIWNETHTDDNLNALLIKGKLKLRDVSLLRTYTKYIAQTGFRYSIDFIEHTLVKYPELAASLVDKFYARFDPSVADKKREKEIKRLSDFIEEGLNDIESLAEDRVLRQMQDTMKATLRTNFFQTDEDGNYKPYTSIKLDCKRVPNLPKPYPFAEIFVHSYAMEGVHLRGGKVARGGLRWSDRIEDFRTEVLGLMKAQMVKNTVIVPTGSKGGFVVKHPVSRSNRDEWLNQGIECYRTFLRGLLDITDNIVDGKLVAPKEVVRHDGDDPYLVVAADKGTATFSDYANEISEEYGFWMGDAFASGGSQGYDHKAMGITARGAWVSVQHHFKEMGIDVQKESVKVVGIGDMSGDVFGNGMLLSKAIKIIAAFDHRHIFVDPNPDPAKSYKERKRLFDMQRSSWEDYDKKLISKGGGIYDRSAKSVPINAAMQKLFGIKEKSLAPDQLIKNILKSSYDLLWNGGIGTYVKSSAESHEAVGDRTNDSTRVDADELNCRVVGEGGNLGLTQLARIEFAENGGRINTDAIDNVAGVNTSDHEVNIKITLNQMVKSGKLKMPARNKLLKDMTDNVAELVLRDNHMQAKALTFCEQTADVQTDQYIRLMQELEEGELLDRAIEFLPDDEMLAQRQSMGKGLSRPEIAVIFGYAKMEIYNDLIKSNLPDDPYFNEDLIRYFPEQMRKKYEKEIKDHQLRREIITTQVVNSIVNRFGPHFFHHVIDDTGVKGCDVARAYIIARDLFDLRSIWDDIEDIESKFSVDLRMNLYAEISNLTERAMFWLLRNCPQPLDVGGIIKTYRKPVQTIQSILDDVMNPVVKDDCDYRMKQYTNNKVPKELASKIAHLKPMASALDIAYVAKGSTYPEKIVGQVYFELGNRLNLSWLRDKLRRQEGHSHWKRLAVKTMQEQFFDQQMRLAADIISVNCKDNSCGGAMDAWEELNSKMLARYDDFIEELKRQDKVDHPMLSVALQRVESLIKD